MTVIHIGETMINAEATIKFDNDVDTLKLLGGQLLKERNEMYEMLENSLNEIYMLVNKDNEKGDGFTSYDDMHMVREIKFLLAKARGEK